MIEMVDEETKGVDGVETEKEVDTVEDTPEFLIHASTGSSCYLTMKVEGMVGNCKLQFLIDLGSTHNFMDIVIAKSNWDASRSGCHYFRLGLKGLQMCNARSLLHC